MDLFSSSRQGGRVRVEFRVASPYLDVIGGEFILPGISRIVGFIGCTLLLSLAMAGCENSKRVSNSTATVSATAATAHKNISLDLGVFKSGSEQFRQIRIFNNTSTALVAGNVQTSCGCLRVPGGQNDIPPHGQGVWQVLLAPQHSPGIFSQQLRLSIQKPESPELWTQQVRVSGCAEGPWVAPAATIVSNDRPSVVALCFAGKTLGTAFETECSKDLIVEPAETSTSSLRLIGLEPSLVKLYGIELHLFRISLKATDGVPRGSFVSFKLASESTSIKALQIPVSIRN